MRERSFSIVDGLFAAGVLRGSWSDARTDGAAEGVVDVETVAGALVRCVTTTVRDLGGEGASEASY